MAIAIGQAVTHDDYPGRIGTVSRHDIDGTTLVRWNDIEEGWEKTDELVIVRPAFDREPTGKITDLISDEDVICALMLAVDRVDPCDRRGEGHPVNIVLWSLETDERFHESDDRACPEIYKWAEENSFSIEEQAWMAWGCEEGCGCSESEFQERYVDRRPTRVERLTLGLYA